MAPRLQGILRDLRIRLERLYGPGWRRLIVFGSQARGDARDDSDVDVLAIIGDRATIRTHRDESDAIVGDMSLEHGIVISCTFATPDEVEGSGLPFYRNVRREGLPV